MGPSQADIALREALALGADRAYLVSDRYFAGADSWATSLVLAKAIEKLGPFDLILAGEKATDGEQALDLKLLQCWIFPFATYVSSIVVCDSGIKVRRTIEEGYQTQHLVFPCLVTKAKSIIK